VVVTGMNYRFSQSLPRAAGVVLLATGLLGDGLAGLLLLYGSAGRFLLWHMLFVLLWGLGVNLLAWPGGAGQAAFSLAPNKWGLAALLLGMGTFPGLGTWACTLAFLFARLFLSPTRFLGQAATKPETGEAGGQEQCCSSERIVTPFVDELREGNTEARRAVVAKLSRAAHPSTALLLRQLLSDAKAEIRSDASIALTCLEDEMSHELHQTFVAWRADPANGERTRIFIDHCYRYATSNVLDTKSQRLYLALARDLLLRVLSEGECEDAQLWLRLADVRQRLGELPEAMQDALRAVHLQPEAPDASLLAMDLAFRCHAWDVLLSLLEQHGGVLPEVSSFQPRQAGASPACPAVVGGTCNE
jgi:tetratricopeptide (TPR) repeat protein